MKDGLLQYGATGPWLPRLHRLVVGLYVKHFNLDAVKVMTSCMVSGMFRPKRHCGYYWCIDLFHRSTSTIRKRKWKHTPIQQYRLKCQHRVVPLRVAVIGPLTCMHKNNAIFKYRGSGERCKLPQLNSGRKLLIFIIWEQTILQCQPCKILCSLSLCAPLTVTRLWYETTLIQMMRLNVYRPQAVSRSPCLLTQLIRRRSL